MEGEWFQTNLEALETSLSTAMDETALARPENAVAYLASVLARIAHMRSTGRATAQPPKHAMGFASCDWTAAGWIAGCELAAPLAAALLHSAPPAEREIDTLSRLSDLSETALAARLAEGGVLQALAAALSPELMRLKGSGGLSATEVQNKFSTCSIQLDFGGVDDYFNGLEDKVGLPQPNALDAMEAEHTKCGDSHAPFSAGNYGSTPASERNTSMMGCSDV